MRRDDDAFVGRLRAAYRARARGSAPPAAPSDEEIVDLVLGRLDAASRDRVADAVAADPDVAARVRALMRVHQVSSRSLAASRRTGRAWLAWAAAASIVLVLGVVAWDVVRRSGGSGVVRGRGEAARAGFEPEDGSLLPGPPDHLAWEPVPGATSYRASLFDASSSPIWRSEESARSVVAIPDTVKQALRVPGVYYWRVTYRLGVDERTLPLVEFRIGP